MVVTNRSSDAIIPMHRSSLTGTEKSNRISIGNVMEEGDDDDGGVAIQDHEPIDPQLATRIGQIREPFSDNKDVLGRGYAPPYVNCCIELH